MVGIFILNLTFIPVIRIFTHQIKQRKRKMPFISKDRVKEIRTQIKKEFSKFKFSITKRHYSSVYIKILSGPIQLMHPEYLLRGHEPVNHFYIQDHFKDMPAEVSNMLYRIYQIANFGNYTESVDGDYGYIPSFYVNIDIGDWDRPYKVI